MRDLRFAAPALCAAVLLLAACGEEKSSRGIELMPDMYHSPAYRHQQAMVVVADPKQGGDGKVHHWPANLEPVPGTVARGRSVYPIPAADVSAARALLNPLEPTAEVLSLGQYGYNVYCAVCHGRDGNPANAYIAKHLSGLPGVNGPNIASFSDGELYHLITHGRARMPGYAAQLPSERRWAVVHYLRALNRASIAIMDVEDMVRQAELALRERPEDDAKKTDLAQKKTLLEQRRHDLDAIQAVGERAGERFRPQPDPRPEYVVPTWPEADGAHPQEHGK